MDGWSGPQNVMLDFETWGTEPGSALRSIGACMFEPHSDEIGETFYANFADESCTKVGLVKDARTVSWWAEPDKATANKVFAVDQRDLAEVAASFDLWWRRQRAVFVWSQGSNFDGVLWEAAMRALGRSVPWKFYDTRDTRTAYDMAGLDTRKIRREGVHHNALDDALHQAKCVQRAYAMIRDRRAA
jgi:hypothetical protein